MKTLTINLADEIAAKFASHAADNGKSAEEWAAHVIEEACDTDWFDELPPEDRAAIEEGLAQADRGEVIAHEQVFSDLKQKHGW